jgi:hypothetical protein
MKTFEEVRSLLLPSHERLISALIGKGMRFAGSVTKDESLVITVTAVCGEVTVDTSGQVELFTENINPYEPYDSGYHAWTLWPEYDTSDADELVGIITRITGDD